MKDYQYNHEKSDTLNNENRYDKRAPYKIWGENLDPEALIQMEQACSLPVCVRGALMPDAHKGYGLPIGGVLAVDNAVIPYAVGVDIACRMCMTILDIPYEEFEKNRGRFKTAIEKETKFGVGEEFSPPKIHKIIDDEDWEVCGFVKSLKDKAWKQLGTSGSGNHFAEFGKFTILKENELPINGNFINSGQINSRQTSSNREYLAFLTHSGSRGAGAETAEHYSKIAKKLHPELPHFLQNLAWLEMDSNEGQEYWKAMELMGRYSEANHEIIHNSVINALGAESVLTINNHHNFAWKTSIDLYQFSDKEQLSGKEQFSDKERFSDKQNSSKNQERGIKSKTFIKELIIHRKGATPASKGVIGIIPGSMASPAFVVKGLGNPYSLDSAAHGAGRAMSRNAAMKKYNWSDLDSLMRQRGVSLISAGLDEVPMAYKNIEEVMEQQKDLISIIGRFDPKLVKMSPPDRKHIKSRKKKM